MSIKSLVRFLIILQIACGCTDSKDENPGSGVTKEILVETSIVESFPLGEQILLMEKDQGADVEELTLNHFGSGRVVLSRGSSRITWTAKDKKTIEVEYLDGKNIELCRYQDITNDEAGVVCQTPVKTEYKLEAQGILRSSKFSRRGETSKEQSLLATLPDSLEFSAITSMDVITFPAGNSDKFFPLDFNIYLPLHPGAVTKTKLLGSKSGQIFMTNNAEHFRSHVSEAAFDLINFSENQSFKWNTNKGLNLEFEKVDVNITVVSTNDSFMQTITKITGKESGISIIYRSSAAIQKNVVWNVDDVKLFKEIVGIRTLGFFYETEKWIDLTINENGRGIYQFELDESEVISRPVSWSATDSLLTLKSYRTFNGVEVADSSCVREGTCSIYRSYEYEVLDQLDANQYLVVRKAGSATTFPEDMAQTRFHVKEGSFGYHLLILKK